MATTAPVTGASDVVDGRRSRRLPWLLLGVAGLLAVLAIGAAGALYGWDSQYEGRVLPGVHVGSVDLSGLDREAAAAALSTAYDLPGGGIVLHMDGGDVAIPYATLGRKADVDGMVAAAFRSGREGGLLDRAVAELQQARNGTLIAPTVTLDQAALTARIENAILWQRRPPVDATITMGPSGVVTTPAEDGRAVDPAPVVAVALEQAHRIDAPTRLVLPVASSPVTPAVGDDVVALAKTQADRLVADVVVEFTDKHWTIKASQVRAWISFQAANGAITPVVDPNPIAKALARVQKGVLKKPLEAGFLTTKSGHKFGVIPGKNGRKLDVQATVDRIVAELGSRGSGNAPQAVKAKAVATEPKLTTEEAKQSAPLMTLLGTWTTYFPISERNFFGANIWRPAQIINGTVLAPGQTFDWWRAVGPVNSATGFGPGGVIKVDHTEPTGALGGGMCSSSTTLFNAALRAGLQMGARSNHRYYINRYPLGLDATVSKMGGGTQTMSFTNDTKHAILIRGIRIGGRTGRGYVRYEIWGSPDGRTVSLSRPVVTNRIAATTKTQVVTTLPHGVRNQTEFPSDGMDVAVTRVVRDASGRVIHSETWRSHYVLWNGIIQVGA